MGGRGAPIPDSIIERLDRDDIYYNINNIIYIASIRASDSFTNLKDSYTTDNE